MSDYDHVSIATGDGRYSLEIALEFGGSVNRLSHCDTEGNVTELIAGCSDRQQFVADHGFRGMPLYPFVNRLDGGEYVYRGKSYQFDINESDKNNALHGMLMKIRPEVVVNTMRGSDAELTLLYYNAGNFEAYPFAADVVLTYRLSSSQGLTQIFRVVNHHHDEVPLGIGWHPYFSLAQQVDELQLHLPKVLRSQVDARMLPTGKKQAYSQFAQSTEIGAIALDDCFELVSDDKGKSVLRLWSEQQQKGIEFWQQRERYPYMHLYIPPDRQSIAIEPVSCGVNAFNTGENLVLLQAGQVFSAECGVRLI